MSVFTKKGQTSVTRTPLARSSGRIESNSPWRACLLAEYPQRVARGEKPANLHDAADHLHVGVAELAQVGDSGVVDQDVHAAASVDHPGDRGAAILQ
jgi:hypothetical protein